MIIKSSFILVIFVGDQVLSWCNIFCLRTYPFSLVVFVIVKSSSILVIFVGDLVLSWHDIFGPQKYPFSLVVFVIVNSSTILVPLLMIQFFLGATSFVHGRARLDWQSLWLNILAHLHDKVQTCLLTSFPLLWSANFWVLLVFNPLPPWTFVSHCFFNLSGARRLNRGSCCTPKFTLLF